MNTLITELGHLGITSFDVLCHRVAAVPYGRVSKADDPLAVLRENVGTCSSKHLLLARLAKPMGVRNIQLMIGLYRMHEGNTPGVGAVLKKSEINWIPEVHCYLMQKGQRLDFTGLPSGAANPFDDLLDERVVHPDSLGSEKPAWHKAYLANWAQTRGLTAERAWQIREDCIHALTMLEI